MTAANNQPASGRRDAPTVIVAPQGAVDPADWSVGTVLEDGFRIEDVRGGRGKSGMGVVYIVERGSDRYAVKTFQRQFSQNLAFIQRFVREAQTWMLVGFHPNVVRAHGLDIINAAPCLFMEFVPSDPQGRHSVADLLGEGPLDYARALDFAVQFCDGMTHATAAVPGLVHRDVKPENLLVDPSGVLKITDFGLVRCKDMGAEFLGGPADSEGEGDDDQRRLTKLGAVFGTPAYMAPEQFRQASDVTIAADVYSFGCCLHEWLVGSPPFSVRARSTGERIARLRRKHIETPPRGLRERLEGCPKELDQLVAKCLEKDPGARWQDFGAMRDRLAWLLGNTDRRSVPTPPRLDPAPREVALQMRSLALLEGYDQAIRLRNLRENQDISPYAFHLALASYFHCHGDTAEERRQLAKAENVRGAETGDEVARRLGEVLVKGGELDAAEALLGGFLKRHPDALDRVLEPLVRLRCAQRRYDEAAALCAGFEDGLRTQQLRAEVLQRRGDTPALAALLRRMLAETEARILARIEDLEADACVGWALDGDADALIEVLALLRPECDTAVLNVVDAALWPDLSGFPDFAPDMAWLSQCLGDLGRLETEILVGDRQTYRDCAKRLGYPDRLAQQIERDEYWFWMQEPPAETDGPDG